jgi:hypothetical protein
MPASYAMRKLANDFPLDDVVPVLPELDDVVVLLPPPPPQPAAITASPAQSEAAASSRVRVLLRFKMTSWSLVSPGRGVQW